MESSLKEIKNPVKAELKNFETYFKDSMKSDTLLLNKVTQFILKRKGKQVRPLFTLLSAKVFGEVTDSTYTAAALIELLHTATLVHDDVVDDSDERRGVFSINAVWKNKIAVLVGDFLLSKGLLLSIENNEHELLGIVSRAVKEMSEGELLQIEKARRLDIDEDIYFEIIRKKTASLIASCCACGAFSSARDKETAEKMRLFGEYVGIAFQIKDDIFDYGNAMIGKPTGIDIKEQKMTLPLIYTLNKVDKSKRKKIIQVVKKHHLNKGKVNEVIRIVVDEGGVSYAENQMHSYKNKALELLKEFPSNDAKDALIKLVNYSIERTK